MPLWTPALLTTKVWLDAADSGTLTLDGSAVSQWDDKSGNANHGTETSTQRPALVSNSQNSLPGLSFDGSNDRLVFGSPILPLTHSMFILFKPTIESVVGTLIGQWASGETGRFLFATNQNSGGFTSSGRLNPFNSTATNGGGSFGFAVDVAISNAGTLVESICTTGSESWKLLKNGTEWESATVTALYQGVNTALGMTSASTASNFYDGLIYEVIIIASVVSATTRQIIEGYLAHKWGITDDLPAAHLFKNDAPYAISGVVRDKTGALAVGRTVQTIRDSDRLCVNVTQTDSDGEFTAIALGDGAHTLIFDGEASRNALIYKGVVPD